jgi:phospholipid/cholesterol/gamma-HCH transport system substrate-binding protein
VTLSPGARKASRRLAGLAFLLVIALLASLSVALYNKTFTPVAMVTLYTGSAGNEMHPGAQVMVRGVQVGEVRQVSANGSGARLELAIEPGQLPRIPANVSAEMLPTTLFGERYVDLILPARPVAATLANGSVIQQDRSADGLELDRVLDNLLPMLSAVQPDKLSLTLTAIAQGLSGRGQELGQTLVTLNAYLKQFNRQLPQLDNDIRLLDGLSKTYTKAAPAILQALSDFGVAGRTIAIQHAEFAALLANITIASNDLRSFLDANAPNAISLSADSLPTLEILARYAPEFPCTLQALANFVPEVNKVLGAGTSQPGLHMQLVVVPPRASYVPSKDTPVYDDNLGPHCYRVPFTGIHLNDGTTSGSGTTTASRTTAINKGTGSRGHGGSAPYSADRISLTGFGADDLSNPAADANVIRDLAALWLGQQPRSVPAWGSLLTGPLLRGMDVTLQASRA